MGSSVSLYPQLYPKIVPKIGVPKIFRYPYLVESDMFDPECDLPPKGTPLGPFVSH